MSFIIPDPRWEMPELLTPGRKPTGNVEIDLDHPLARGLIQCHIFRNSPIDLVNGYMGTLVGGASIDPKGLSLDGTNDHISEPRVIQDLSDWTVFVDFNINSTTDNFGVFFHGRRASNADIIYCALQGTSRQPRGVITNSGQIAVGATAITLDTRQTLAYRVKGTEMAFWLNGVKDANTNNSASVCTLVTKAWIGSYAGAAGFIGGHIHNLSMYNRALSEREINSLHRNPYQFLIPA